MVPAELIIYALLIGLGVGMFIGRTWAKRPAITERVYIVVAPSLAEGQRAAREMRATFDEARAMAQHPADSRKS
jgi:hypothetical protein